jgi:endonuclease/exonuclease/phosphatase family metal-dependent hydrolase
MRIRVMSYNIQHGMDYMRYKREKKHIIDFDLFADVITSQKPDVVVLNEVRNAGNDPEYEDQTRILAEKTGFTYYRFGEAIRFKPNLPYGNALLSKYPITEFDTIKIPDPEVKDEDVYYETRCVIRAKVNLGDRSLTVFGSHFGLANSEQRNAVKTVVSLIDASEKPYVLMGDFNMVPEDEKLIPIYERMTDTAIYFNEPKLSFPSDKPDYKIDYIFVSKDLKVTHADIPDIVASDHRLHICDIEF